MVSGRESRYPISIRIPPFLGVGALWVNGKMDGPEGGVDDEDRPEAEGPVEA